MDKVEEIKKRLDNIYKLQAEIIEEIATDLTGRQVIEITEFIANHPHNKNIDKMKRNNERERPGIK